jgi:4-amino-4-deoxy-L-arabinose transferase-like glycosyltransferase
LGLLACAVGAILAFVAPALFRLSYPYPLQLTEPASLEEVRGILVGQPLYVAPTLSHVPMIYGPIYFYLSAAVALVAGPTYLPLRAVSLIASIGTLCVVAYLVYHETRSRTAALVSAGLLAATYPVAETTLDLGRVDALFAFFAILAIALARARSESWALLASGSALGLAALTKVPLGVAPVALALSVYLLFTVRLRTALFLLGLSGVIALGLLVLRAQSGPWPTWYLWDLPRKHVINDHGDLLGRFWFLDILPRFTFPLLIGPLFVLARFSAGDRRPLLFYTLIAGSLVGVSWAARSNSGGATNVLLPVHMLIALLFGLGLYAGLQDVAQGGARISHLQPYLLALCIAQFALLAYNPRLLVPFRSEEWAAQRLETTLGSLPGALFAPDLDGYVNATDKGEQPLLGAVEELTAGYGGSTTTEGRQWERDLDTALHEQRFSHIVLNDPCCDVKDALDRNGYVDAGPLFPPGDDYWLWTSNRMPNNLQVYVPATATP